MGLLQLFQFGIHPRRKTQHYQWLHSFDGWGSNGRSRTHAPNVNIWHEPTTDSNLHEWSDSHIIDDVLVNHFQTPCPEEEERRRRVKLHLEGALIPSMFDKHVKSLCTILDGTLWQLVNPEGTKHFVSSSKDGWSGWEFQGQCSTVPVSPLVI